MTFEEIQNLKENDDILFIVDVQKEFSKFIPKGYVDKLFKYCNEFKTVYQIWDSNKATSPSYTFPNQVESIEKKYGTKFNENMLNIVNKLNDKYPNAEEGFKYKLKDECSFIFLIVYYSCQV